MNETAVASDPTRRDFVGITDADSQALEAYYDDWAVSYDHDMPNMGYDAPHEIARLVAESGLRGDAPLLDAGCGTGLAGQALRDQGFSRITGVDQSRAMLDVAGQKACYTALVRHDLNQRLPFVDDAFAAATLVATLTYIDDARALLTELCRVVRRDGPIALTHRDDLYDTEFANLVETLEDRGLWVAELHSAPADYIPGHPQFGTDRRIHYDLYRVC